MGINILILAAGQAEFETHDGGHPICLTELAGHPVLELIVSHTHKFDNEPQYHFALLKKDMQKYHLDKVAKLLVPQAIVFGMTEKTQGSGCTALFAASQMNMDNELLIISANEIVYVDLAKVVADFRSRNLDGGTLTFRSVHPRYSYVRLNEDNLVIEVSQQNPISHHATAGIFWFARTSQFVKAVKNMIRKNNHVNGKFFIAPSFNQLILKQGRIGVQEIDLKRYQPLKTKRQVHQLKDEVQII